MRNLIRGLIAALALAALPLASQAGVFVSVTIAPPVLPVYEQPAIPGPGYIWTPGYWAWDGSYYWVPGTWVLAPVGLLWTPGYWGWVDGAYFWHAGYWGPHVGFYGGVDYGFGYGGVGFVGGEWRGGQLYYNRSVTNISTTNITNVYNRTVVNNVTVNHTSFNGGPGGIAARPDAAQLAAEHERHVAPLQVQTEHRTLASHDNGMRASVNGGRPAIAATSRPAMFTGNGVVAARGAQTRGNAFNEGRGSQPMRPGANPASERLAGTRGGSNPANARFEQPRGGNNAPPREYTQQPRGGNNAPPREYTPQPRGGNNAPPREYTPQPRGGGGFPAAGRIEQPRGNQQPRGTEQRRGNEQRGNEQRGNEQRPRGDEQHPH
jgi:hypothetical protein